MLIGKKCKLIHWTEQFYSDERVMLIDCILERDSYPNNSTIQNIIWYIKIILKQNVRKWTHNVTVRVGSFIVMNKVQRLTYGRAIG